MCGICGFLDSSGASPDPAILRRMNDRIIHRGPDEDGEWVDGPSALAMRRLSIIDLSGGQQPIFNEDRTVGVVFNGEIYNYLELRRDLEARGHRFYTHSDTETIVHLYEDSGDDGIARLNGMFAVALWDTRRRRLLLARDRAGKKPLYWTRTDGGLAFSSEMHSLLAYPGISRDPDWEALDNYFLFGYVPSPLSIFRAVHKLEAGSLLTWEDGRIQTRRYWRLQVPAPAADSEPEAAARLESLIEDAVRIRLHSDVPFGALLSGGVDSSLVVGLMSRLMSQPVKTFTIGFSDKSLDETSWAAETARRFGTEHHTLHCEPPHVPELVHRIATHFGEPFADPSAIPTFLVSQLARRHVTMVLTGDGGDEVFGGYRSYRYHRLIERYRTVPAVVRGSLRAISAMVPGSGTPGALPARADRFLREAELPVETRWAHSRALFTAEDLDTLYAPEVLSSVDRSRRGFHLDDSFRHFVPAAGPAAINLVDYETYMADDILVKVDRMSMANSLEVRSPLLDYRIAEYAASLPAAWKWTARDGKRILKQVAARLLPADLLGRPKQGFVVPIRQWFRAELAPFLQQMFGASHGIRWLNPTACQALLERHQRHPAAGTERKLWTVLCFLLWYDQFAE